jgi:hypothetical protein
MDLSLKLCMVQVTLDYISLLRATGQQEDNTQQLVDSLLAEVEKASADTEAHASFDVQVRHRHDLS